MLPELPVELHRKIYAMACMDDSKTGCALSLVNRAVREASADVRWYSLAVSGKIQVYRLWKALEDIPNEKRKVFHLCISDIDPLQPKEELWSNDSDSSGEDDWNDSDSFDSLDSASICRALMKSLSRDTPPPKVSHSIMELLDLVEETLKTLTLSLFITPSIASGISLFLPEFRGQRNLHLWRGSFPELRELTLRGNHPLPDCADFAPKLKMLNISDEWIHQDLPHTLAKFYSQLTHLRVSRFLKVRDHYDILIRLMLVLRLRPGTDVELQALRDKKIDLLPEGIPRFFLVEPGPTNFTPSNVQHRLQSSRGAPTAGWRVPRSYRDMVSKLTIVSEGTPNFALLPEHPGIGKLEEAKRAKQQWMDRMEGGPGCWVAPNKHIPLP